ncbi:MAG: glycerol-3-phosphate acyltransferase [Proteobacteria bacterium]|nr:glycerol-3-phosphate acyltransferase [Pseudomonadota bacterium]NCA27652.1 glycerol-3-phosphate acyltransferase [Pseudomonadota bacterium]
MDFINLVAVLFYSYALGCFCSAYYLVKIFSKQDIRTLNSGTVGARNAGRILGKKGFVITFVGDFLKTGLPLGVTIYFFRSDANFSILFLVSSIAVMLGHLFPAQLKLKGGKGVVVFTAIIFVINFWVLLISLGVLFLLLLSTHNQKISIVASVLTTIPSSLILMNYYPLFLDPITILTIFIAIILLIISHLKKAHVNL